MNELRLYVALYADADVNGNVVDQLKARGYDAVHAAELKHDEWEDDELHLIFAAEQNRALLTHNIRHFKPLYDKWWQAGRKHSGIIVAPQWEAGLLLRRLLKLLDAVTADEMINNYKHLGEFE